MRFIRYSHLYFHTNTKGPAFLMWRSRIFACSVVVQIIPINFKCSLEIQKEKNNLSKRSDSLFM